MKNVSVNREFAIIAVVAMKIASAVARKKKKMANVLEVKNLKKYFGATHAVDDISFALRKGEIFGFLGPNGAGKTTTIRCLMDFIKPDSGRITILDKDAQQDAAVLKRQIGYLPGNVRLYDNWTGTDHISLIENIRGKSTTVSQLIKSLDFNPKIKVHNLSSGNKQKLGLIMALMHEPELLIMDEPTVGLDPLLQNAIYEILEQMQSKGTTILMSSHNLPEVERLCDHVGIIKQGKIITEETIESLHQKRLHQIRIYFDGDFNDKEFTASGAIIEERIPEGIVLSVKGDINPLIKLLGKYKIKDLQITHGTLEEIFLEFYQK